MVSPCGEVVTLAEALRRRGACNFAAREDRFMLISSQSLRKIQRHAGTRMGQCTTCRLIIRPCNIIRHLKKAKADAVPTHDSLDEVDPEVLRTFEKLVP